MKGVFSNANYINLFLMIFLRSSLHCMLVPVLYREYENGHYTWSRMHHLETPENSWICVIAFKWRRSYYLNKTIWTKLTFGYWLYSNLFNNWIKLRIHSSTLMMKVCRWSLIRKNVLQTEVDWNFGLSVMKREENNRQHNDQRFPASYMGQANLLLSLFC